MFWQRLQISIAGAKLSHLVQKDSIWDHGSMTEQARITFYQVLKAKYNGNQDVLKKYMTISCFNKMQQQFELFNRQGTIHQQEQYKVTELAVISVMPGKNKRPDQFTALIKGFVESGMKQNRNNEGRIRFVEEWSFVRMGDWWVLDKIK